MRSGEGYVSNRVVHVPELSRYELLAGDGGQRLGFVDYRPAGVSVIVSHTEIAPGNEGMGLGAELVSGALDAIRASGKTVIPTCPFTAAFIHRHPEEYADLVDPAMRGQFQRPGGS
jgi:predicted GNAT family acetyltransferase